MIVEINFLPQISENCGGSSQMQTKDPKAPYFRGLAINVVMWKGSTNMPKCYKWTSDKNSVFICFACCGS